MHIEGICEQIIKTRLVYAETIVGKGENAGHHYFPCLPLFFQRDSLSVLFKSRIVCYV